jgi:hypothetical protein
MRRLFDLLNYPSFRPDGSRKLWDFEIRALDGEQLTIVP